MDKFPVSLYLVQHIRIAAHDTTYFPTVSFIPLINSQCQQKAEKKKIASWQMNVSNAGFTILRKPYLQIFYETGNAF